MTSYSPTTSEKTIALSFSSCMLLLLVPHIFLLRRKRMLEEKSDAESRGYPVFSNRHFLFRMVESNAHEATRLVLQLLFSFGLLAGAISYSLISSRLIQFTQEAFLLICLSCPAMMELHGGLWLLFTGFSTVPVLKMSARAFHPIVLASEFSLLAISCFKLWSALLSPVKLLLHFQLIGGGLISSYVVACIAFGLGLKRLKTKRRCQITTTTLVWLVLDIIAVAIAVLPSFSPRLHWNLMYSKWILCLILRLSMLRTLATQPIAHCHYWPQRHEGDQELDTINRPGGSEVGLSGVSSMGPRERNASMDTRSSQTLAVDDTSSF